MTRLLSCLIAPLIYGLFGIVGLNLIEIAALRDSYAGVAFLSGFPVAAALTFATVIAACVFFDSILGRRYIGATIVMIVLVAVGLASGEKQRYLLEPLFPWDFLFAGQVLDLLPQLMKVRPKASAGVAVLVLASLAALVWVFIFARTRIKPIRLSFRIAGFVLGGVILAGALYSTQPRGPAFYKSTFGIKNNPIVQKKNYKENGFILAFLLNVRSSIIDRPANYSKEALENIAERYASAKLARETSLTAPNVVMIMSEAFWDPTQFPGVSFDHDPLPFVHSVSKGDIFAPVFGGGTANTEFEALTGFSNAFLPEGSFPYQQYIARPTPALPWYFRSLGYRAVALHPYQKWFWSRDKIYPRFGFDHFIGLSDMKQPAKLGPYVSDEQLNDFILTELDAEKPTFLFTVTMQNHTPFQPKRYGAQQIQPTGNIDEDQAAVLSSFTQGIEYSDKALRTLTEKLKKLRRPTLLVFFGDHAPGLGDQSIYRRTGVFSEPSVAKEMRARRTPLVVLWSDGREVPPVGTISPAFIPELILRTLGKEHPFYSGFLGAVRKDIRVNDRAAFATDDSPFLPPEPPQDKRSLLNDYYAIQYDQMIGGNYARAGLFCEMPGQSCDSPKTKVAEPSP